ncbi:unnamed protein product [Allacma fusca]|uniref:Secreted protein n=1 Tax=Allacma fusca TaxID=39272 RepID=A0A8J2K5M7_9HEXA|nr:unnamed protein product [Allacma fusca]
MNTVFILLWAAFSQTFRAVAGNKTQEYWRSQIIKNLEVLSKYNLDFFSLAKRSGRDVQDWVSKEIRVDETQKFVNCSQPQ